MRLTSDLNPAETLINVDSTAGSPMPPFEIRLEPGTEREERCWCINKTETTFTVIRGYNGSNVRGHEVPKVEALIPKVEEPGE